MNKVNRTASEVQLKARRTSLGKKSNDELISIILRKDKSERSMNSKIQQLTTLLKETNTLNEENATRILDFETSMKDTKDIIKTKQEQIDALISKNNVLIEDIKYWSKKYADTKDISSIYKKGIFTCLGIIAILIILLI